MITRTRLIEILAEHGKDLFAAGATQAEVAAELVKMARDYGHPDYVGEQVAVRSQT